MQVEASLSKATVVLRSDHEIFGPWRLGIMVLMPVSLLRYYSPKLAPFVLVALQVPQLLPGALSAAGSKV